MISLELPIEVEQRFRDVVEESYHGNIEAAVASLLVLHDKYAWKEQLREDVEAVRAELRRHGGLTSVSIQGAIDTYRKQQRQSHE